MVDYNTSLGLDSTKMKMMSLTMTIVKLESALN